MGRMRGICVAWALAVAVMVGPVAGPVFGQSLEDLRRAADAGTVAAQVSLAERYRLGEGVLQSYAQAARYFQAAADQGDAAAQNALGGMLIQGLGGVQDQARGFALLSQAAASGGPPKHLFDLATAYDLGLGTQADPARAAEFYTQAAEAGHTEAQVALAVLVQEGRGVAQDVARAVALYQGPAAAGHTRALNNLGLIYARGSDAVPQDFAQALTYFTQAAQQGMPEAMRNLATLYANGFGVAVDEARAAELNRRAAQGGGSGVTLFFDQRLQPPRSEDLARLETAGRGDPVDLFLLGYVLATDGAASNAEYRRAARAFEAASHKGMPAAMGNLGLLSFAGRGVLQDFVEGYAWMTVAARVGTGDFLSVRDQLAAGMTPAQISAAETRAADLWAKIRVD